MCACSRRYITGKTRTVCVCTPSQSTFWCWLLLVVEIMNVKRIMHKRALAFKCYHTHTVCGARMGVLLYTYKHILTVMRFSVSTKYCVSERRAFYVRANTTICEAEITCRPSIVAKLCGHIEDGLFTRRPLNCRSALLHTQALTY